MRHRTSGSRTGAIMAKTLIAAATLLLCAGTAQATLQIASTVNIDWNSPNTSSTDQTYVGSDGVLSNGGTVWNGVDSDDSGLSVIVDEFGNEVDIEIVHENPFGGYEDNASANDLMVAGFDGDTIHILLPAGNYDVALYRGFNSGFAFTHGGGTDIFFGGSINYALPGTANVDYRLWTQVGTTTVLYDDEEFDGFTINNFDGQILGAQIGGVIPIPEPTAVALMAVACAALLRRRP